MIAAHNLERFIQAQKAVFQTALAELRNGRKVSHWMWFIFPQIQGLGFSETSRFYAIKDLGEAEAYLQHRVLGPRLMLMCFELMQLKTSNAHEIFGSPDDLKFHSSLTLFFMVAGSDPVFTQLLEKFYQGQKDNKTLKMLSLLGVGKQ